MPYVLSIQPSTIPPAGKGHLLAARKEIPLCAQMRLWLFFPRWCAERILPKLSTAGLWTQAYRRAPSWREISRLDVFHEHRARAGLNLSFRPVHQIPPRVFMIQQVIRGEQSSRQHGLVTEQLSAQAVHGTRPERSLCPGQCPPAKPGAALWRVQSTPPLRVSAPLPPPGDVGLTSSPP